MEKRTIEIKYPESKRVTVKGFPTKYEIKKLNYSPNKIVERGEITSHNKIDIKLYNIKKGSPVTVISGGRYNFKRTSPPGTVIEFKIEHGDEDLKRDISEIARELCEIHLRPGTCYPGIYSTRVKIDYFHHTNQEALTYIDDFSKRILKKVSLYKTRIGDEKSFDKDLKNLGDEIEEIDKNPEFYKHEFITIHKKKEIGFDQEEKIICSRCGTECKFKHRYCTNCGNYLR